MRCNRLGDTGIEVSALGLGCNAFGARIGYEDARTLVHAALDEGVTFFDTADGYGSPFGASEEMLGKALRGVSEPVVIATKGGANPKGWDAPANGSSAWLTKALDDSLSRLGVERIDYYQLHFPDPATPLEETLAAMDAMVRSGKVRAIGCSNFSPALVAKAAALTDANGWARLAASQEEYHMLAGDRSELIAELSLQGMGLIPYFPLAGGLLTGKYRGGLLPEGSRFASMAATGNRFMTDRNLAIVENLARFFEARGMTMAHLAIAWLLAEPVVSSVIAGATNAGQLRSNVAGAGIRLSDEDMLEIWVLNRNCDHSG